MATVKGIEVVVKELRKYGKDIEKQINAETEDIAFQIENDAKKLAPKNFGKLGQSIYKAKTKESQYKIMVNELYGVYMEFGTGTKVKVPNEFKDMASGFKGQKQGTFKQGLEAIKIWCRAKGIDEKAAYPIFAKILGAGINPQPFLFPSWTKGKKDYLTKLKLVLGKFNKKI